MRLVPAGVRLASFLAIGILAQTPPATEIKQVPGLKVTSRAVLIDVIVTDPTGKPFPGISKNAFTIEEQGKAQSILFFEEHGAGSAVRPEAIPKLPPDTFSNFSPLPEPPALNVILLDGLNTRMESQRDVHRQVLSFLGSAKPGSRSAIFAMGLTLKLIQGFNDDPAVLAVALSNKKNLEVENPVLLKSQAESNAQKRVAAMGAAGLAHLFPEMDGFNEDDRKLLTLGNLQRMAVFLRGFPGRKNIIWFVERPPGIFNPGGATGDPAIDEELKRTLAMLGAARAALYPVDARGISVNAQYTAENNPVVISTNGGALKDEDMERNTDQMNAQLLAEESGGRAFANTNGLSDVLDKITSESQHFYTLSYAPSNMKMDGGFRKIQVHLAGGKYKLLYRSGYYAVGSDSPSNRLEKRVHKLTGEEIGAADPLLPQMDLGAPQSQQILVKARIVPTAVPPNGPPGKNKNHYSIDLTIGLNDLSLVLDDDGVHKGTLNVSLVVYDHFANTITRQHHLIGLNIKPDVYTTFQNTGVQLHFELAVPKGDYWLRSGVHDQRSHKTGTLEVPLAAVEPLQTLVESEPTGEHPSRNRPASRPDQTAASTQITVRQLEQYIEQFRGRSDKGVAQKLSKLKLNEKLGALRLDQLQRTLPGEQSRLALLAIADASAFYDPPPADVDLRPAPDQTAEKQILSRAVDFVRATTSQMPNFLAERKIIRFQDAVPRLGINFAVLTPDRYHFVDSTVETVRFRNGQEELDEAAHRTRNSARQPRQGLITTGVFGPMLQTVMHDILKGAIGWSRWEVSEGSLVAVFHYTVPKDRATFTVSWCCSPQTPGSDDNRELQLVPAYHGEISVEPESGTVTHFTVVGDLDSGGLVSSANVLVDYGPVEIGGRTYQCPVRSVTLLVAKFYIVHRDYTEPFNLTSLSDTRFDQYHIFRSEMKILER